ncbi:MAG TPA: hypothetical protein VJH23_02510 [archaeon]|nr:hypothetical protein [archaeon]
MVDRQTRMKKKRFAKTPGGRTAIHYSRSTTSYAECAVTGHKLAGTGNQTKSFVRKKAKTHRRPSVKFGGVLSSGARKELWENYALVISGKKQVTGIPAKLRKFVQASIKDVSKDSLKVKA